MQKTLIDLNQDCLLEIFEYLRINDLIALNKVSSAFDESIIKMLQLKNYEISLKNFASFRVTKHFLWEFQFKIKKLNLVNDSFGKVSFEEYLDAISPYINTNDFEKLELQYGRNVHQIESKELIEKLHSAKKIVIIFISMHFKIFETFS